MNEMYFYKILLIVFAIIAVIICIALFFISAPYGRYSKPGWGPLVNNKLGWVLMEAPASILMAYYFFSGNNSGNITLVVCILIWQAHYFHRAFIYPFTLRGDKRTPLSIIAFAIVFNVINTYMQGRGIFYFHSGYSSNWIHDPRFIMGLVVFITGFVINKHADYILRTLRKPGESGYKIPVGGLYAYISCPNYFGEVLTWAGWAILTWSLPGAVFLLWTIANLAPRAWSHHKWYKQTFADYPSERKALVPFVF